MVDGLAVAHIAAASERTRRRGGGVASSARNRFVGLVTDIQTMP
ncbi:MAG: hypothetical protein R2734_01630 [Nocardioides sp.]